MTSLVPPLSNQQLSEALELMKRGLEILDEIDAPGPIGASLDLAISRLSEMVGQGEGAPSGVQRLIEQLEYELSTTGLARGEPPSPWEIPEV